MSESSERRSWTSPHDRYGAREAASGTSANAAMGGKTNAAQGPSARRGWAATADAIGRAASTASAGTASAIIGWCAHARPATAKKASNARDSPNATPAATAAIRWLVKDHVARTTRPTVAA